MGRQIHITVDDQIEPTFPIHCLPESAIIPESATTPESATELEPLESELSEDRYSEAIWPVIPLVGDRHLVGDRPLGQQDPNTEPVIWDTAILDIDRNSPAHMDHKERHLAVTELFHRLPVHSVTHALLESELLEAIDPGPEAIRPVIRTVIRRLTPLCPSTATPGTDTENKINKFDCAGCIIQCVCGKFQNYTLSDNDMIIIKAIHLFSILDEI